MGDCFPLKAICSHGFPPICADACRLNVALTRAKHNLLIVGCAPALQQSAPALAALLARCRSTPMAFFQGRLPPPADCAAQAARMQAPMLPPPQPLAAAQQAPELQQQQKQWQRQRQRQGTAQTPEQCVEAAEGQEHQRQAAMVAVGQQATAMVLEDGLSWSADGADSEAEDLPLCRRQQQLQLQHGATD